MTNQKELSLPKDLQLEREILGCCFNESTIPLSNVRAVLGVHEFAIEDHRRAFRALCRLADSGQPLTHSEVFADLQAHSEPVTLGYLWDLDGAPDFTLDGLLRRAKDLAKRRGVIFRSHDLMLRASDLTSGFDEIEKQVRGLLAVCGAECFTDDAGDVDTIIKAAGGIDAFMARKHGISSPWPVLDYCTGGWQAGELILLAARPSVGKTALALNAAYHAAARGTPTVFYSFEMTRESLVKRLISLRARISYGDLQRAELNRSERRLVTETLNELIRLPLRIVGAAGKTALAIHCHAERLCRKGLIGFAIVDYIGLVRGANTHENRSQELGEICRQFKETAGELDIPMLVLSQLSLASEARPDKRPVMTDLRDSGELENHADLIAFIHRPGYYNRQDPALRLTAELIIAKQRNDDTPVIPLVFQREYGLFESEASKQ